MSWNMFSRVSDSSKRGSMLNLSVVNLSISNHILQAVMTAWPLSGTLVFLREMDSPATEGVMSGWVKLHGKPFVVTGVWWQMTTSFDQGRDETKHEAMMFVHDELRWLQITRHLLYNNIRYESYLSIIYSNGPFKKYFCTYNLLSFTIFIYHNYPIHTTIFSPWKTVKNRGETRNKLWSGMRMCCFSSHSSISKVWNFGIIAWIPQTIST